MRRMRWLMCGFVMVGTAQPAGAADLSDMFLRGSSTVITAPGGVTWDGIYFGGHVGASWTGTDFANATQSLVAFMLRQTTIENEQAVSNWTTLGKADTSGSSFGGFIGYQTQWEGAVMGIEAGYSRTNMQVSASDVLRRVFSTSDGYSNDVQVNGAASVRITDYGTLRARAGWAAGCFLPYGFVGLALARADVTRSATVIASGVDISGSGNPPYSFTDTRSEIKSGTFAYGYTAGLGIDMALMQNIFVRAEYEYIFFGDFNDLKTHIHTARVGAGLKF
jgi:outer membrane immunogenic protein